MIEVLSSRQLLVFGKVKHDRFKVEKRMDGGSQHFSLIEDGLTHWVLKMTNITACTHDNHTTQDRMLITLSKGLERWM